MKIKIFFCLSILFCLSERGWADTVSGIDTTWIVNYQYSSGSRDTFEYVPDIPEKTGELAKYNYIQVVWGDRTVDGEEQKSPFFKFDGNPISLPTHKYAEGMYDLMINFYENDPSGHPDMLPDYQQCRIIFNRDLSGSITIEGRNGCMEDGADTFLVRIHNHEINPKGTQYSVEVQCMAPVTDRLWGSFPATQNITDSVYVVFYEPTGNFGAMIQVNMTYKENEDSRFVKRGSTEARKVYVYSKPDLHEIFHYKDTLKDEFRDYPFQYLELCTGSEFEPMKFDSLRNIKFAYADGSPMYRERYNFDVQYYRKDSVNQTDWVNVTSDKSMVDTVDMLFNYPGFYKIEMVAENVCGRTFLSTEDLRWTEKKQLIKVYQNGKNTFECKEDRFCGVPDEGVVVTIMDRSFRFAWDASPAYDFSILRTFEGKTDTVKLRNAPEIICYKDGNPYSVFEASTMGCDSTRLQFRLYELGAYEVTVSRSNYCGDPVEYSHAVSIGDVPLLPQDVLWTQLGVTKTEPFRSCGEYVYTLPEIDMDERMFEVDSIGWYFEKKSCVDTLYQELGVLRQYAFDSLGDHKNYIRLRARNYCGWSLPEELELYTDVVPQVSLWRDSVEKNDSLCVGVEYEYYWVGNMPQHYSVRGLWQRDVEVNGSLVSLGYDAILASTEGGDIPRVGRVKYNHPSNRICEYYQIWNTKNPSCLQELKDSLAIVSPPDGSFYKDTVWHCEDFLTLEAKQLFQNENPGFSYVEWKFNEEAVVRDYPDAFNRSWLLSAVQEDSLQLVSYSSKGCRREDKVVFLPVEKPDLVLKQKNLEKCADVTLGSSDYTTPFIQSFNGYTNPDIDLKVYQEQVDVYHLIYDVSQSVKVKKDVELNRESKDTVRLIYEGKNKRVTPGFGDCMVLDTLALKVWKPLLEIRGSDTLRGGDNDRYELKKNGLTYTIDTADIKDQRITWTLLDKTGNQVLGHNMEMSYLLQERDHQKDFLEFELSGSSACGEMLRDTLVVYLSREQLWAHSDTICVNDPGYLLWGPDQGKTSGKFINPSTLKWTLLPDKNGLSLGSLTGTVGELVKYVPGTDAWKADTVKIEVKGWNQYDLSQTGKVLTDTVFLKVNKPAKNIFPDTLYLKAGEESGRTLVIDDIRTFRSGVANAGEANSADITWDWAGDGGMNASFVSGRFYLGLPYDEENYTANFNVKFRGLKGCPEIESRVIVCGVMPPVVSMSDFDLCDGSSVRVDTGYRIKGEDGFLRLSWSTPDGNGQFVNSFGQLQYQAGVADPVTTLKLDVSKVFTLYDGVSAEYRTSVAGTVHLYRKPRFHLQDGRGHEISHDTLCVDEQKYVYKRDWIAGENFSEANCTMLNMVANRSIGLSGDFPEFTLQEGVTEARLIVTPDFGTCKKWEDIGDTIYITKLTPMNGSFEVPSTVCEGGEFEVEQVTLDSRCKSFSWLAQGGTVDQSDLKKPKFTATGTGKAALSMLITPPHGCLPVETITKEFDILEKPVLVLRDTLMCENGELTFGFAKSSQMQSIAWKANGRVFQVTAAESEVTYHYKTEDVVDGKIRIVAEITPQLPCKDKIFSNEMCVTVQQLPSISGSLQAEMCQGDSLRFSSDIVSVSDYQSIQWTLNGSAGELKDANTLTSQYFPGETSGRRNLLLKVKGLSVCPEISTQVEVHVLKADLPEFTIPAVSCIGEELEIRQVAEDFPSGGSAVWALDGAEVSREWSSFRKTFSEAGEHRVRLTVTLNGKCPRFLEKQMTVHSLPQTDFVSVPDSIVGDGNEVHFTNITPGTVSYGWDFHGYGTEVRDEGGVYVRRYDCKGVSSLFADVTLTVTDINGCRAAKTHTLKVVGKPHAEFEVTRFDPCSGEVELKNVSTGENLDFYWNLGNGYTSVDTVPVNLVYPPVYKDSVYHITLQVTNKAGISQFTKEVKVISLLSPRFVISPDKEGCEGKQLNKGFSNRTEGDADSYTFSWGDGTKDQVFTEFYPFPVYHSYHNPDTQVRKYAVTLTAANSCHKEIYKDSVSLLPSVISTEFTLSDTRVCFGNEIVFKNQSFGFAEDVQAWWYFDSDTPLRENKEEFSHRFDVPGIYPVFLVMTDRCNSDTSDVVPVRILGDRSLAFSISEEPYCSDQEVTMKVRTDVRERFTGFEWDLGDGEVQKGMDSVRKVYKHRGTYPVTLTANALSEGNCPVTAPVLMLKVNQTPDAFIEMQGASEGCHPHVIEQFSRGGEGDEQIFWDFQNAGTSTDPVVQQVLFGEPGVYPVLLRLTSPEGCIDTAFKVITVMESPEPAFEVSAGQFCSSDGNLSIGLRNQTKSPQLFSYEWSYNDRTPFSRMENPDSLKLNNEFGEIRIELLAVHHENGCRTKAVRQVVSGHQVQPDIRVDSAVCLGVPVDLLNVSVYGEQVRWELGDGSVWEQDTFSYVYDEPGIYRLKAVVANAAGCADSLEKTVKVYPLPVADFSYEDGQFIPEELDGRLDLSTLPNVKNGSIRFKNHSFVDSYGFSNMKLESFWSFGDGAEIAGVDEPEHYFDNNGQYGVRLLVCTPYGCCDSVIDKVSVDAVKGLFIPNAFAPGAGVVENPGVALFQPKGIGLLSYEIKVYDQSGTCVWSSDKLSEGHPAEAWDGTFKGEPLPGRLYTWEANAIFIDGSV